MLADFYIPRFSNDMKITLQKNHLVGQILYRVWSLLKKRRDSVVIINTRIAVLDMTILSYPECTTSEGLSIIWNGESVQVTLIPGSVYIYNV